VRGDVGTFFAFFDAIAIPVENKIGADDRRNSLGNRAQMNIQYGVNYDEANL